MSVASWMKGKCRLCGDTFEIVGHATVETCGRCERIRIDIRSLSFTEVAKIIDAAAGEPLGTHRIVKGSSEHKT
jgi:hypothetical protein